MPKWVKPARVMALVLCGVWSSGWVFAQQSGELERRKQYLEQLRRILPASPEWEDWLERSRELPPDFAALPSCAELPNPLLRRQGGREVPVTSPAEWAVQRNELKQQLQYWLLGSTPPPPDQIKIEILREEDLGSATAREVVLRFGPTMQARLWLELMIPKGKGPFPVFLTQENHRGWAILALRRGYLACVYAGCDSRDDTDTFLREYPQYDWSRLTRRAWAASRCIDYLETVPEADTARIAITGHSRNGKQALIAAALDERIDLVISSSSGAGGAMTSRYLSEQHFGEGIELITRRFPDWFHPRWRFFVGREQKLPVDLHELVALAAPRPCLLSCALNDGVESVWAMEQTYLSVKPVYRLLGAEDRIRILWREGGHETSSWLIERYLDWCDLQFGRGQYEFPEHFVYPVDWDGWKALSKVELDPTRLARQGVRNALLSAGEPIETPQQWEARKKAIRRQVAEMLGEEPPRVPNPGETYGLGPEYVASLLNRASPPTRAGLETWLLSGDDLVDAAGLAKRLQSRRGALERHIWDRLPADVRARLAEASPAEEASIRALLAHQLNRILTEDSLLAHLEAREGLSPRKFRKLFSSIADPAARARANRILLEEVFPGHVQRTLALLRRQVMFGEYIQGDLIYQAAAEALGERIPVVLWLHPISHPRGYAAAYMRGEQPYRRLARAGFAVFCFDQIGHGWRIHEATNFYQRHPRWSLLGKTVRDAQAALDVLGSFEFADTSRIWVVGYATGALVALHLAAFEDRPCGWVLVCPPPPFRLDADRRETGGISRWAQLTMLLPRLGFFVGHEDRVPYDLHELMACMAPRQVLVVAPTLDREAPPQLVAAAVEAARPVFQLLGAPDALTLLSPEDYNHFGTAMQDRVIEWLREHALGETGD